MTRLEGSYDINQESSCRRRCCYNTTKSTCTTPGRQMKIGVVWQCLRLLFGVVILRQTTGAAALCEDLIVLEEIGHDLEITADCSVRGQALIEWSSQSSDQVERIQLEYGCDVDMYNLDAELLIAQQWTSRVKSGSVNISIPDDALCVILGCYMVDGDFAGVYPVEPVNCSRAIPTSTTDVGSGIPTSAILLLPSTALPRSTEDVGSASAILLLPSTIPPGDTLSPTSTMKDMGSVIPTSAISPLPSTIPPGDTLSPTSTMEGTYTSTTDVGSGISTSAILPLPSTTLPRSTEGSINDTYIIISSTAVFGVLILLLSLCIIIVFAVNRFRQKKSKDKWTPDQVVNTAIEIVSTDLRRSSITSEKTVYESLEKNDGCILNLSDPQQENHFSFLDGDIGSDKCSFAVSEKAPDNTMESIATQENTHGNTADDTCSKSHTVVETHDTYTTSQCPQILYTQKELPQPSPVLPATHSPSICIPMQLTSTGDGYCRVVINNTVNNSGHGEYQSIQHDSTQFYVSET